MDPGGSQSLGSPTKGGEWASGKEKRLRKKPTRAEEETDGDRQTGAGAVGLFERLPGQRPHTVDTSVPLPLRTKQRTAAGPHASPRPASWSSGSGGGNPQSPGQGPGQGHRGQTSPPPGCQERAGPQSNQPRGRAAAVGSPEAPPGENEGPKSGCSGSLAPAWAQGQAWIPPTHKGSVKAAPGGATSPNRRYPGTPSCCQGSGHPALRVLPYRADWGGHSGVRVRDQAPQALLTVLEWRHCGLQPGPNQAGLERDHPTPVSGGMVPHRPQLPKTSLKISYLLTARAP